MVISSLVLSIGVDHLLSQPSGLGTIIVLYIGPDQMLPLASALGAIIGVLLLIWHRVAVLGRKAWQRITRRGTVAGSRRPAPQPRQPAGTAEEHIGQERAG
jgi:hypothetical protein